MVPIISEKKSARSGFTPGHPGSTRISVECQFLQFWYAGTVTSLRKAVEVLRSLRAELLVDATAHIDPLDIADRVGEAIDYIDTSDHDWVGTTKAKRLLGVASERTIRAWADKGVLESRQLPNGRIQVIVPIGAGDPGAPYRETPRRSPHLAMVSSWR